MGVRRNEKVDGKGKQEGSTGSSKMMGKISEEGHLVWNLRPQ